MRFGFFTTPQHRRFSYTPRYYDERKERITELQKKVSAEDFDKKAREYRIRETFANKQTKHKGSPLKKSRFLIYIILVLAIIFMVATNVGWMLF
ncbi:hypothetical protein FACS1894153_0810 [Bacteroidia bacterium]|nr:hypothetical protein FACS1894153_0810 [Bacteroidia bacterium]